VQPAILLAQHLIPEMQVGTKPSQQITDESLNPEQEGKQPEDEEELLEEPPEEEELEEEPPEEEELLLEEGRGSQEPVPEKQAPMDTQPGELNEQQGT